MSLEHFTTLCAGNIASKLRNAVFNVLCYQPAIMVFSLPGRSKTHRFRFEAECRGRIQHRYEAHLEHEMTRGLTDRGTSVEHVKASCRDQRHLDHQTFRLGNEFFRKGMRTEPLLFAAPRFRHCP